MGAWNNQSYLNEFLNLKSVGDILNVVSPIGNHPEKEISESMGMIKQIKKIVIRNPMQYELFDFCAGNALTSIISVFLLPVKKATAIDVKQRNRPWYLAKKFDYNFEDIFKEEYNLPENSIIIGIHTCRKLANRIIEIFNNSEAKYLLLMPCCIGEIKEVLPTAINEKLTKPERWAYYLYTLINAREKNIIKDNKILSPHNYIIKAMK